MPHSLPDPQPLESEISISVVIPIYNGAADLPDLLDCLQHQTFPGDRVEYLLVDNGSHDQTATIIHAAQASPHPFALRYLSETDIQSAYAARNTGIRAAQGSILAFTDADCRPQPQWLSALIAPFADPQVGLVAGEITAFPGSSLLERYADRHAVLSQKHTLAHPFCPYGQTANLALRRQILDQVGLFRPYLTTGGDADLCWRILQQTGWKLQLATEATVQHRHRTTLAELRSQWQRYGRSNRYLHQLHGVSLTRAMTGRDYVYRGGRWLLKEIPQAITSGARGRALIDAIADTPLDLLCSQARDQGQRQARLPLAATEIASLAPAPEACSAPASPYPP
ncbi:MAG: glycosyltransferase [Oscillatoriophycideae cyanobacterium NC_groundwater_1537_Pr4_S-0.65um_50_18]|nr:glycosyltransferase [Oscillatoriophycideae cyanobacterium NC_groundwater_1537_Pr4_S-0.65um_50_18]